MISYHVIGNRVSRPPKRQLEVGVSDANEEGSHIDGTLDMVELIRAGGLFPDTAEVDPTGRLMVGGCELSGLAERFGTPLYVYDEAEVRGRARALRSGLERGYRGRSSVCYASKAYCAPWLLTLLAEEGVGLDVVSGGELYAAAAVGFPMDRVIFHGNNKSSDELVSALELGVGRIVLDNLDEIRELGALADARRFRQPVLLRVAPGVDADTHEHVHTGGLDSKFGLGIHTGQAAAGAEAILAQPALDLRGFHLHIGSQISDLAPYREAIERIFAFATHVRERWGTELREINPGGGFGVNYVPEDRRPPASDLVRQIGEIVTATARAHGFHDPLPELTIEPGRSMVATSAVALYRVGSVKMIPDGRTYVAVDGGMADNIRPTAYGVTYTAILANRAAEPPDMDVAIAGKYCETGDILIQRVRLPSPRVGDLVAVPTAGAYQLAMASNYNLAPRPAVVVVRDGIPLLVRRRETYAELLQPELFGNRARSEAS
jgi:diaminopimelate decarboxylase